MSDPVKTLLVTPKFRVEEAVRIGGDGRVVRKAIVRHPGAVAIVPLVDSERICLIRNYRVAAGQTLIEIPAGTREPGEKPEETASRELLEETGYRATRLTPLCQFFMSPGVLDERMHVFLAEELSEHTRELEAGEEIENLIVPWQDALAMIEDGRIQDAKTIVALSGSGKTKSGFTMRGKTRIVC